MNYANGLSVLRSFYCKASGRSNTERVKPKTGKATPMKRLFCALFALGSALIAPVCFNQTGILYAQTSESAVNYFKRGNQKFANKEFNAAFEDYSAAIAFDPNFAAAYLQRGNVELQQGNLAEAITDYNHALTLKPKLAEAYAGLSAAHFNQGDFNGALADASKAIELDAHLAMAYNNRGNALQKMGQSKAALADYSKAL